MGVAPALFLASSPKQVSKIEVDKTSDLRGRSTTAAP